MNLPNGDESAVLPAPFNRVLMLYSTSQINYDTQYTSLYTAYNAWYREVTGSSNDRVALSSLKKRYVIWDDFYQGKTLRHLQPYTERLAELTQREPLPSISAHWGGELQDKWDWRALIEYWYQVRCLVVHGASVRRVYVWLAYETLSIFMEEIIQRTQQCYQSTAYQEVRGVALQTTQHEARSETFRQLRQKLARKYQALPDLRQVDMQRAGDFL